MHSPVTPPRKGSLDDEAQMRALQAFTARTLVTAVPVPFGASVVSSADGRRVVRAVNAVAAQRDPTCHAEVRAIRLACKKLGSHSLAGHTLYTTCEPCPMCMAAILWAGLDGVVYGATIEDAARYCNQIHIGAREVAERADMGCEVVGPVAREACLELFNHPNMLDKFALWKAQRR